MSWKDVNLGQWSRELGVDMHEIDQKLKLRDRIVRTRKQRHLSQEQLVGMVGVSRTRIVQIENGVKLHEMSFDVLFKVLGAQGWRYSITARRRSA